MRHSYRSWLDAVGTPIAVQQKLMRHADIRTTMNIYGDVVTNQESEAHSKIVGLALPRAYWRYGSQLSQVVEKLAERVGFEPTLEFPLNTLSKRAPSATRPSLRLESWKERLLKRHFDWQKCAPIGYLANSQPFAPLQFYGGSR